MELAEKIQEEEYQGYIEDVRIAVSELTEMKLYPVEGDIVCDLYAIPSHNYQSYYAIVYEKAGRYEMLYAKPQFYDPVAQDYIRMYRFKDAKVVEDHPVKDGKIIMGIKQLSEEFVNEIKAIASCFPAVKKAKEDSFTLDGYFQVIRIYKSNTVYRELFFRDVEDLVFPDKKDEISELLDGIIYPRRKDNRVTRLLIRVANGGYTFSGRSRPALCACECCRGLGMLYSFPSFNSLAPV